MRLSSVLQIGLVLGFQLAEQGCKGGKETTSLAEVYCVVVRLIRRRPYHSSFFSKSKKVRIASLRGGENLTCTFAKSKYRPRADIARNINPGNHHRLNDSNKTDGRLR